MAKKMAIGTKVYPDRQDAIWNGLFSVSWSDELVPDYGTRYDLCGFGGIGVIIPNCVDPGAIYDDAGAGAGDHFYPDWGREATVALCQ